LHWRGRDLGTLGGAETFPAALNASGEVVGQSDVEDGTGHAFLWRAGRMIDLGSLPGYPESAALGINSRGEVIVQTDREDESCYGGPGFLWAQNRVIAFPAGWPWLGERAGRDQ
jgi:probable HAF family extracellular repeat protein